VRGIDANALRHDRRAGAGWGGIARHLPAAATTIVAASRGAARGRAASRGAARGRNVAPSVSISSAALLHSAPPPLPATQVTPRFAQDSSAAGRLFARAGCDLKLAVRQIPCLDGAVGRVGR
jgi:hypothetical protein